MHACHSPFRDRSTGSNGESLWWRIWSRVVRRFLAVPAVLVPDAPLPAGFENISIGGRVYEVLKRGTLDLRRARLARFAGPDALQLDTSETIAADVVVLATGCRPRFGFLHDSLAGGFVKTCRVWLSRHILPPQEPQPGIHRLCIVDRLSTDLGSRRALAVSMFSRRVASPRAGGH